MIRAKIRQNLLAFSAIIAILGLVIDMLFIIQIGEIKKQKEHARNEERALLGERQALDKLVETVALKQPEMEKVGQTLPTTINEFVGFVNDLSAVATASGISMKLAVDPDPKVEKKSGFTYRVEGVVIELDGAYSDGINFLERIYNLPYYLQIETVSIKKIQKDAGVHIVGKMNLYMR